jgi:hypothetical protein
VIETAQKSSSMPPAAPAVARASEPPMFSSLIVPGKLLVPIDARPEAMDSIKLSAPSVAVGERLVGSGGQRAVLAPASGRCVGRAGFAGRE